MKRPNVFLLILTMLGLACLWTLTAPSSVMAKAKKKEKEKEIVDYYTEDSWGTNFQRSLAIWKKDLKFSDKSLESIKVLGEEAELGWRVDKGRYFSLAKLLLLTAVFWLWVATSSWTNNDTQLQVDLNRVRWNLISILVFPLTFLVVLFIPFFWVGYPILVLSWLIPTFVYVHHRNTGLLDADKVMTPDHLGFLAKRMLFMNVEPRTPAYETGSPIELFGSGKDVSKEASKGRAIAARNVSGFNHLRELVYQGIHRNAMIIRVEQTTGQTRFFFFIDGVWIPMNNVFAKTSRSAFTPEEGAALIESVKVLCGCNREEHVRRQTGEFLAKYDGKKKLESVMVTQGKQGMEEVLIQFQFKTLAFHTLEELGMTKKRQETFKRLVNAENGLLVFSAPPAQGMRTLTNVAMDASDRFIRDFVTVEDAQKPYIAIENIPCVTYDSAKKETPMTVLPDVFFKEPKVLLIRDIVNLPTFQLCCEEVQKDRLIITSFRGADAADTIIKLLQTGIDPKLLASSLSAVVCQRLIRRLCPACKEQVPAHPEILKRLGLNPNTVQTLWRKRVHQAPEPGQKDTYVPCEHCMEIGYWGRAGVYDVIEMNDEIRQLIAMRAPADAIRKAVMKTGNRGYLNDAIQLVADGVTSFDELRRFMQG